MNARKITVRMLAACAVAAAGVVISVTPAGAANTTTVGAYCMQRIFMGPNATVSGANQLNCTANDIRLSGALSVSPATCIAGQKFDLTATFRTAVTANSRYDAAFFFRIDGGATARGDGSTASGTCSVTQLDPAITPAQSIDADSCGDLNAGIFDTVTFTIPQVECLDSNGDGFLNLPNCTSWHSNQGTACTARLPIRSTPTRIPSPSACATTISRFRSSCRLAASPSSRTRPRSRYPSPAASLPTPSKPPIRRTFPR